MTAILSLFLFGAGRGSAMRLAVVLLVFTRNLAAQTPVPLVHGFNENGGIWSNVAAGLAGYDITTHTPTLNSWLAFSSQANELIGDLPASALVSPIMIGHSNGGLVSREVAKSRSMRGIFTFGTPNGGAPIAVSYPFYLNYVYGWLGSIVWAAVSYDESLLWEMDATWQQVVWYALIFAGTNFGIPALVNELIEDRIPPEVISQQTDPSGEHISYLNSAANLAVEAGNVQHRVGIVVSTDNASVGGPLRFLNWSPSVINGFAWSIEAAAVTMYILAGDLYWDTVNNYWEYDEFYYPRPQHGRELAGRCVVLPRIRYVLVLGYSQQLQLRRE